MKIANRIQIIVLSITLISISVSCSSGTTQLDVTPEFWSGVTLTSTDTIKDTHQTITAYTITPYTNKNLTITPTSITTISSPLEDIEIKELPTIISRPFSMPIPGKDDGHHGVDLSFYAYKNRNGISGLPVLSIFPGKVSSIIYDRFPYGNTVIIETKLENISKDLFKDVELPPSNTLYQPATALNCPDDLNGYDLSEDNLSFYILYAHLKNNPSLELNETVDQGQVIGQVGTTGFSTVPHLHLEMRIGPSDFNFNSIAHYVNDVSEEEIRNYCIWRVSGIFKLLDPMTLLN